MEEFCIINCQYPEITKKIQSYGYNIIETEKSCSVNEPVSLHADMLYLKADNIIYISDCQKNNIIKLKEIGYKVNTVSLYPGYETECKLNFVITKNLILHNPNTAMDILAFKAQKQILHTKQGYTKCSTIVIDDKCFITEDASVFSTLSNAGKNCLMLQKGYIKLDGYDYGFIGGASAYLPKEKILLFFGDITKHPDYCKIINFCNKNLVNLEYISNMPLTDIGGAVII